MIHTIMTIIYVVLITCAATCLGLRLSVDQDYQQMINGDFGWSVIGP